MELCIYSFIISFAVSVLNLTSFPVMKGLVKPKLEVVHFIRSFEGTSKF